MGTHRLDVIFMRLDGGLQRGVLLPLGGVRFAEQAAGEVGDFGQARADRICSTFSEFPGRSRFIVCRRMTMHPDNMARISFYFPIQLNLLCSGTLFQLQPRMTICTTHKHNRRVKNLKMQYLCMY